MIKNTIYIRDLSDQEKKILEAIAQENSFATGLETIRFIIQDYKSKKTALEYQAKVLTRIRDENDNLKESFIKLKELEKMKNEIFKNTL